MTDQPEAAAGPQGQLDFSEKMVIILSGILSSLALTAINSVLPLIERDLARSPMDAMMVKQLIGGVGLAMVIGAPLGGVLADRLGLRRMLIAASVVYTIAGTAGLYVSGLQQLLASRLLLGVASASIQVMGLTMINTRLTGSARARWMGLHVSIAMFGTLLVHPAAGILGGISWRLPFLLYLLGAVLFVGLVLGRPAAEDAASAKPSAAAQTAPAGLRGFPWHYLALAFVVGAVTFMPTIYIPFQMRQQANASPETIAAVLTGTSLGGALMALAYGRARNVLSTHAAFMLGFALAGTGSAVTGFAPGLAGIVAGTLLYSIGVSWFVPNLMTALGSKVSEAQQGRAAGLVKAAHFLAAPVCVALVEPFARSQGAAFVMLLVAALSGVMLVIMTVRALSLSRDHLTKASHSIQQARH